MTSPEPCLRFKFFGQSVPLAGAMLGFAGFGSRTDFTLVTQVLCSPGTTYWKCQIWNERHFQGNTFSVFLPAEARCSECFRAGSAVGPALVGPVSAAELRCKLWVSCSTAAALHSYPRLMLLSCQALQLRRERSNFSTSWQGCRCKAGVENPLLVKAQPPAVSWLCTFVSSTPSINVGAVMTAQTVCVLGESMAFCWLKDG